MINKDCFINLPYPTAVANGENKMLADRLSALYAGRYSELSAITTYLYQHIILKGSNMRIADILECISVTEMRHMELLGELIRSLGGDPIIAETDRRRQYYWNGSYAGYATDAQRIISDDIRGEQRAIADYTAFLQSSEDKSVNAVIERIIRDEELHVELLRSLQGDVT